MSVQVKDFLGAENARNKANAALYEDMLRLAYPGEEIAVLVGHHICFEFDKNLDTENEIPAADTLIFDHDLMLLVFGINYLTVIADLAQLPADKRDALLRVKVDRIKARRASEAVRQGDFVEAPAYTGLTSLDT